MGRRRTLIPRLLQFAAACINYIKPTSKKSSKKETPLAEVEINGEVRKTLFDTGADVSLINHATFQKIKNKCTANIEFSLQTLFFKASIAASRPGEPITPPP